MNEERLLRLIGDNKSKKNGDLVFFGLNIKELPPEIGDLVHLTYLSLWGNKLECLPPEIGNLINLQSLDLHDNLLKKLPPEISNLKRLKHIDIRGNKLTFPPPEILYQGTKSTLRFLKQFINRPTEGVIINEAKLLIVGEGGVGKTCLKNRLIYNEYNDIECPTEGIVIDQLHLSGSMENNPNEILLNIWDFGGQDIYHATHQFFLTQRSLYILVWDARQGESACRLEYWLNTLKAFAGDSPILIVLNKTDCMIAELNQKKYKQQFPQIAGFLKISCKTRDGIDQLIKEIYCQAKQLSLMGTFWFKSWLEIRKLLEKEKRAYMPYSEFLSSSIRQNLHEVDTEILVQYLHDIGAVLYFKDDIYLKNILILKPKWLTEAAYKILSNIPVQENSGLLSTEQLPNILENRFVYPPEQHALILRLMENFELIFPIEGSNKYIVASLLPFEEIDYSIDDTDNLCFEYHYDFLPPGVIPKLIVRMHDFLVTKETKNYCWREGAILEDDSSKASVIARPREKKIIIKISGKTKREFLSIIRAHISIINNRIKKINFKEMIPCNCYPDCTYLFDYNTLRRREQKKIYADRCGLSDAMVNIPKLLDGIENPALRKPTDELDVMGKMKIDVRQIIENKPVVNTNSYSISISKSNINIILQNELSKLQSEIFNLLKLTKNQSSDIKDEIEKIDKDLLEINPNIEDPQNVNIGPFNRLRRFFKIIGDENSDFGLAIRGIDKGIKTVGKIAKIYNKISPLMGLPGIPGF